MKNEQFLQLLGEIDDKHLLGANRDIERWLEDQNGIEFKVERPRKKSPWKIIAAVSCSAAAVLGAFVLARNITKLDSIGNSGNTGDNVFTSNSAEQNLSLADYEIKNLDYSNALVIENVPRSGQWKKLSYERTPFGEQSADKLVKMAADYGVAINKDDIMVRRRRNNLFDIIPLAEADFDKYEDLLYDDDIYSPAYPYFLMYYASDELHIETIPSVIDNIEINNNKNLTSILELELAEYSVWKPGNGNAVVVVFEDVVDPDDEDKTCVLNGKTVKVADAVRNAQKIISESDVFLEGFDTEMNSKIWLYTYENGNQALELRFTYTLDGVSYMSPPDHEFDLNRTSNQAYSVHFFCGMLTENSLDWICQSGIDGSAEFTTEECEINVSQEDALKLVSQNMAQDDTFIVREIQLVYANRLTDGGNKMNIEPTWMIYLANDEKWDSTRWYAYVSAVDGKTNVFKEKF